jgi:hypothetical protein
MSFTCNSIETQKVTYNGSNVQSITIDSVEVWSVSADKPIGICLVQTGGGTGTWAWVAGDGTQVPYGTTPETTVGTAIGIVMTATSGGGGQWQRINQNNVAV